ncbi:hypothetical protein LSAT2_005059 [Lamellibrachia satsuma]|nr:hypothetical protein LSAT2_005059 [Lamellibrachia satsuma]
MLTDAFRDGDVGIDLRYRTDGKLFNLRRLQAKTKVNTDIIRYFLFAEDCALNASSEADMQRSVDKFSIAYTNVGLTISKKKTEVLHQPAPGKPYVQPNITVNGDSPRVSGHFEHCGENNTHDLAVSTEQPVILNCKHAIINLLLHHSPISTNPAASGQSAVLRSADNIAKNCRKGIARTEVKDVASDQTGGQNENKLEKEHCSLMGHEEDRIRGHPTQGRSGGGGGGGGGCGGGWGGANSVHKQGSKDLTWIRERTKHGVEDNGKEYDVTVPTDEATSSNNSKVQACLDNKHRTTPHTQQRPAAVLKQKTKPVIVDVTAATNVIGYITTAATAPAVVVAVVTTAAVTVSYVTAPVASLVTTASTVVASDVTIPAVVADAVTVSCVATSIPTPTVVAAVVTAVTSSAVVQPVVTMLHTVRGQSSITVAVTPTTATAAICNSHATSDNGTTQNFDRRSNQPSPSRTVAQATPLHVQ